MKWQSIITILQSCVLATFPQSLQSQLRPKTIEPANSAQKILGPVTIPMAPCKVGNDEVRSEEIIPVGVVRIIVPSTLTFEKKMARPVKFKLGNPTEKPDDASHDDDGTDNKPDKPSKEQPFHIFLKNPNFGNSGFVLVKVIIRKGMKFQFYKKSGIQGVGYGGGGDSLSLCGNHMEGQPHEREVARFFIDLARIQSGSGSPTFNIGIVPDLYPETPIFIDPKVRNDG